MNRATVKRLPIFQTPLNCFSFRGKKGSSREKNQHAEKILRKLLREATWINIHMLPVHSLMLTSSPLKERTLPYR
jgi:hypothetical protein